MKMKQKRHIDQDALYSVKPIREITPSKQYKRLEANWYEKIRKSGFADIEDTSKPDRPLKAWHNFRFKGQDCITRSNCSEYFHDAKELLNSYQFKNPTHRRIWELHCQGMSKRDIEPAISHMKKRYKREQIGNIISIIAREIKL